MLPLYKPFIKIKWIEAPSFLEKVYKIKLKILLKVVREISFLRWSGKPKLAYRRGREKKDPSAKASRMTKQWLESNSVSDT